MSIVSLARELAVPVDALIPYGRHAAKLEAPATAPRGRIVLVSAITATSHGEGKTTLSIGLADALRASGERAAVVLRQPSLAPLLGIKGSGSGGGRAALVDAEHVDVHFTGDLHAVAAAHDLVAAVVDNHLHHATELDLDPRSITWPRAIDVNDRALRRIIVGLGSVARETGFVATAASELMAVLALARDRDDLRARIARVVVGARRDGRPVTVDQLGIAGTAMRVLGDAVLPNVTSTLEATPAFVHAGPYADIAHGCPSVIATRAALGLADWVVLEAGFGFDLGGEKFFDIMCPAADLDAAIVIITCTTRSFGELGHANLAAHVAAARSFGKPVIVAINRYADDDDDRVRAIVRAGEQLGVAVIATDAYARGSAGALALARSVVEHAPLAGPLRHPYASTDAPRDKLRAIATKIYGARDVQWTPEAAHQLDAAVALGAASWPVCVAKPHTSLSDDVVVREVRPAAGARFWVALAGHISLMPGLPRHPRAEQISP